MTPEVRATIEIPGAREEFALLLKRCRGNHIEALAHGLVHQVERIRAADHQLSKATQEYADEFLTELDKALPQLPAATYPFDIIKDVLMCEYAWPTVAGLAYYMGSAMAVLREKDPDHESQLSDLTVKVLCGTFPGHAKILRRLSRGGFEPGAAERAALWRCCFLVRQPPHVEDAHQLSRLGWWPEPDDAEQLMRETPQHTFKTPIRQAVFGQLLLRLSSIATGSPEGARPPMMAGL